MISKIKLFVLIAIFSSNFCFKLSDIEFEPKVKFTEEELREKLTDIQYDVIVNGIDEKLRSGIYYNNFKRGTYNCTLCGEYLFDSRDKFEEFGLWKKGFNAFTYPRGKTVENIEEPNLKKYKYVVRCENCGSFLGRTSLESPYSKKIYYINSASLNFDAYIYEKNPKRGPLMKMRKK